MKLVLSNMAVALAAAIVRELEDWKAIAASILQRAAAAANPNGVGLHQSQRTTNGTRMAQKNIIGATPAFASG